MKRSKVFLGLYILLILVLLVGVSAYIVSVASLAAFLEILKGVGVMFLITLLVAITKVKWWRVGVLPAGYFFYVGMMMAVAYMVPNLGELGPGHKALLDTMPWVIPPIILAGYFLIPLGMAKEKGK